MPALDEEELLALPAAPRSLPPREAGVCLPSAEALGARPIRKPRSQRSTHSLSPGMQHSGLTASADAGGSPHHGSHGEVHRGRREKRASRGVVSGGGRTSSSALTGPEPRMGLTKGGSPYEPAGWFPASGVLRCLGWPLMRTLPGVAGVSARHDAGRLSY